MSDGNINGAVNGLNRLDHTMLGIKILGSCDTQNWRTHRRVHSVLMRDYPKIPRGVGPGYVMYNLLQYVFSGQIEYWIEGRSLDGPSELCAGESYITDHTLIGEAGHHYITEHMILSYLWRGWTLERVLKSLKDEKERGSLYEKTQKRLLNMKPGDRMVYYRLQGGTEETAQSGTPFTLEGV